MLIKFRHFPSPNLNRVPFKIVPTTCPVWYYFATKLTERFICKVFLWSIPVKEIEENANTFLRFLYELCSRMHRSVCSWLFKVKQRGFEHDSILKEMWWSVSVPRRKKAETAVWHCQASSNSLQLQIAASNRTATGIPSGWMPAVEQKSPANGNIWNLTATCIQSWV